MSLALNVHKAEGSIFLAHKKTFRLPVSCLARYIVGALKIKHTVSWSVVTQTITVITTINF